MGREIENVTIGACRIKVGGVDVGHTQGAIEIEISREYADLRVNELAQVVDKGLITEGVKVTLPLAETDYDKLKKAFPLSASGATSAKLPVGNEAGQTLRSQSAQMVLHPLNRAESDLDADFIIHKAVATGNVTFSMDNENQRIYQVEFEGLADITQSEGNYLCLFGDPS